MGYRAYRPRRASKQWREGAPEYVLSCHDAGPNCKHVDRFLVFFGGTHWEPSMGRTVHYLAMSEAPTHPQGYSEFGECLAHVREWAGPRVRWLDLPGNIRAYVVGIERRH